MTPAQPRTLRQLFVPMYFETLFLMLAGMADTLMLSAYSNEAVGAVGTANTYMNMFIIMFGITSTGMTAVLTQYIGAGRPGVARQARRLGLCFNAALGAALSLLLGFGARQVLTLMGIAPGLLPHAVVYLRIVGGSCLLNALIPIFANALRAFGHTRWPAAATVTANVLNVALNAVFLFGLRWGVAGVALATALSRAVNLAALVVPTLRLTGGPDGGDRLPNRTVLRQILRVGLPSAAESALYNVAVALVVRFLNAMDTDGINMIARSYAVQLCNLSYCAGVALGQANAVLTGWRIGAREYEACDRGTHRAAFAAAAAAAALQAVLALLAVPLMRLFTADAAVIALVQKVLAVDVVLEVGRAGNLVYGNALKTSGDAVFTTGLAVVFMFLCAVGGTWLFGLTLGMGAVGAQIGMALDECTRAVGMMLRWRSGRWRQKELITR